MSDALLFDIEGPAVEEPGGMTTDMLLIDTPTSLKSNPAAVGGDLLLTDVEAPSSVAISISTLQDFLLTDAPAGSSNVVTDTGTDVLMISSSGPMGKTGPPGIQGVPGVNAGSVEAISYQHNQAAPSSVWTITHQLSFKPAVTVIDSAGSIVFGDVTYSGQTITVTFSAGFSGTAYLS